MTMAQSRIDYLAVVRLITDLEEIVAQFDHIVAELALLADPTTPVWQRVPMQVEDFDLGGSARIIEEAILRLKAFNHMESHADDIAPPIGLD